MNDSNPLVVATQCYYWKPMAALFRALELRVYRESGVKVRGPVLDLGCGDGQVISMLKKLGVVQDQVGGLEISAKEIAKAYENKIHKWLLQGSANDLPFKDESFSSIISNGVLCSIPEGVGDALREVHRVLKKEGTFVVTVPTDKFSDVLLVPKVLRKFSVRWSSWYIRKLNARLPHYNLYSAQEWERHFEKAGFSVIPKKQFFSEQAGNLWSLFAMHMVRPCGFLKFVRIQSVENCMSRFLQFVCGNSYSHDKDNSTANYGYLFLVGMKK